MSYLTWTLLAMLCCISTIDGETNARNNELDLVRDERFLLDDVTFHDPQAYVSTGSLTFKNRTFYLDGQPIRILSGSIHYFRVPEYYWRDRLLKMKAGGLNSIQMKFIQLAHNVGLHVIFRPGPYICGEWDLGGLPSLELQSNGIEEMFFTSDGYYNDIDTGMDRAPFYKEALPTANFDKLSQGIELFRKIANLSQDFPLMVTEYWAGWFDQWGGKHQIYDIQDHETTVSALLKTGASMNFYMYHGGTNFGFTSGANWILDTSTYVSDVTSYDYDAPLSEAGDMTLKYNSTRNLIQSLVLSMLPLNQHIN
ncbi:hypothetical protein FSP39_001391 [Pinctada imbricata]|uniref:Glycoside hydrolase 35 catalytic domain-containing protein n=1 Tax=Pinctada imbricata TaxID=66713 RepID=A0AA88XT73_PINIB|nr:hypothetical protein FSP39_001391 [Pinctada imbricata]